MPPSTPQQMKEEIRLIWDAVYELRDTAKWDMKVLTVTKNTMIDFPTYKGKPVLVILKQDGVGGHILRFATKFKGINAIVWDTTANTYSSVLFFPLLDDLVFCVSGVTGGAI